MSQAVGIRAIAVNFPECVRTNDYWKNNHPQFLAELQKKNETVRLFDMILKKMPTGYMR